MISDVPGVVAASFVIDTHFDSKYLLRVGEVGSGRDHSANPTFVSDVFTRTGGQLPQPVHAEVNVQINSNNVIGDHFWIWRGDHGRGIRWDMNTSPFGLVVAGNDVTMHGLFVEHYQKWQTVWLGERGRIFFYQSETPYEFPFQVYSHSGMVLGWADVKVASNVREFFAYGMGLYGVHNHFAMVRQNAIEVPHSPGVMLRDLFTNEIGGTGGGGRANTRHVINNTGDPNIGPRIPTDSSSPNVPGGNTSRRHVRYFHNGSVSTVSPNVYAYEFGDGGLLEILRWVMTPCGGGRPTPGWDQVWDMRPASWTGTRPVRP